MPATATTRLEMLRNAPLDSWVALSEDETRVIAVGKTYSEAAEQSEKAGVDDPVIIKTPSHWAPMNVSAR